MRQFASVTTLSLDSMRLESVRDLCRVISVLQGLKTLDTFDLTWMNPAPTASATGLVLPARTRLSLLNFMVASPEHMSDPRTAYLLRWMGRSGVLSSLKEADLSMMPLVEESTLPHYLPLLEASKSTLEVLFLSFI